PVEHHTDLRAVAAEEISEHGFELVSWYPRRHQGVQRQAATTGLFQDPFEIPLLRRHAWHGLMNRFRVGAAADELDALVVERAGKPEELLMQHLRQVGWRWLAIDAHQGDTRVVACQAQRCAKSGPAPRCL